MKLTRAQLLAANAALRSELDTLRELLYHERALLADIKRRTTRPVEQYQPPKYYGYVRIP